MSLPKNEANFDFDHLGELTGKRYEGQFTVKCVLDLADKRALEIEKSRLTADLLNPTGNLSALGSVIANLRVRVLDGPDWFLQTISTLKGLLDEEVIFELYGKCLEKSDEWRESIKKKAIEKIKETEESESEGNVQTES